MADICMVFFLLLTGWRLNSMANTTATIKFYGTTDIIMGNIIANVASLALCLSQLPTIWRIWKIKSTEGFHPHPYVAAFLNCHVWFLYFLPSKPVPIPSRFLSLFLSNGVSGIVFLIYSAIFFIYTTRRNRIIMGCSVQSMLVVYSSMAFFSKSWFGGRASQTRLIGPFGVVFGIIMYGSPLSITKNVYETNNVEYFPYWPCWAYFLNGLVWFICAFLPPAFDPYIAITHGVGALLGLLQLGLYYKFRVRSKNSSAVHFKV